VEAERKLADQRLKEWSKDQEEYTEKQFQEVQKRKQEQTKPQTMDPGLELRKLREGTRLTMLDRLRMRELEEAETERRDQEAKESYEAEQRKKAEELEKSRPEREKAIAMIRRKSLRAGERQRQEERAVELVKQEFREKLRSIGAQIEAINSRMIKLAEIEKTLPPWRSLDPSPTDLEQMKNSAEKKKLKRTREEIIQRMDEEVERVTRILKLNWLQEDEDQKNGIS
jgi:hypothetical protein